ncbi:abortive infection family protein [Bradyrhizobium diazoefficiens]|nr:hypothetical protein XF15B_58840 [Bradyrhizobium diazoefficiens]
MAKIKPGDMRVIDEALGMGSGYVLDFSDRTYSQFFDSELQVDIDQDQYFSGGSSKAKRLRTYLEIEPPHAAARALRALWIYRENMWKPERDADPKEQHIKKRFFEIVHAMEGSSVLPKTDALERFTVNETLEELISGIERDVAANRPAAALDRLHTYCMKKFAHVLNGRGIKFIKDDPLHTRAGKYIKALETEGSLREISLRILKTSISIFESFNAVRNNGSFAHDNEIVDHAEARFIFDAITNILRFMKAHEAARFGA